MGNINDIYRLTFTMTYLGVECNNVFYYRQESATGNAEDVTWIGAQHIMSSMSAIQSNAVQYNQFFAENMSAPTTDFHTRNVTATGVRTGEKLSAFYAWGFTYFRSSRIIRSGGKRFCGVTEDYIQDGQATSAALTTLNATATTLGGTYVGVDPNSSFAPVLVRYTGTVLGGYTISAVDLVQSVGYTRLTTQNTRKS